MIKSTRARRGTNRRASDSREIEKIQIAANSYCIQHYAIGYTGSEPRRLSIKGADVWIVPVVLTSPGYGVVGEVGALVIDDKTHEVIGASPVAEVKAAGSRLAREKRDGLDTAFRQARKH